MPLICLCEPPSNFQLFFKKWFTKTMLNVERGALASRSFRVLFSLNELFKLSSNVVSTRITPRCVICYMLLVYLRITFHSHLFTRITTSQRTSECEEGGARQYLNT